MFEDKITDSFLKMSALVLFQVLLRSLPVHMFANIISEKFIRVFFKSKIGLETGNIKNCIPIMIPRANKYQYRPLRLSAHIGAQNG